MTDIKFSNLLEFAPEKTEHEMIKMKGFIIIINHRPGAQTVLVESYINHGMVDEELSNMGISHLLEHICTDGWKKCKKNCSTYWKKRGAVMNASTGQTYVNYYIHGLNQYLYELMDYIITISINPNISKGRNEKEKTAVKNELLIHGQNPQLDAYNKLNSLLFSVEGLQLQDDIEIQIKNLNGIDTTLLNKWVSKYYGSGNTLFSITGDFSNKGNPNSKKKILKYFEKKLRSVKKTKIRPYFQNVFQTGISVEYVENPKINNTTIYFSFHSPLFYKDFEVHYISFFKLFVNSSVTSLLMYELREKNELIYNTHMDYYTTPYGTYFTIDIATENSNISEVVERTLKILKIIANGEFPREHLNYVKKAYLVKAENANKNNAWLSNWYSEQYINQFNDITNPTIISHRKLLKKIEKLSKSEFVSFTRKLIIFSNLKIVYNGKKSVSGLHKKVLDWLD
tara:strand:+ start:534 stop:1895 length:1362 start_codon:yes stop_codon:yes gene_type:complete